MKTTLLRKTDPDFGRPRLQRKRTVVGSHYNSQIVKSIVFSTDKDRSADPVIHFLKPKSLGFRESSKETLQRR